MSDRRLSYQVVKRGRRLQPVAAFPFPSDAGDHGYAAFRRATEWCRANGMPSRSTWIDVEESPLGAVVITEAAEGVRGEP